MRGNEPQLSAEDLRAAGIKSLQNASELIDEAQLLFDHGHWSRTVFLCCIAGEELGKCFISLSAVMNRRAGGFDEHRYKKRFRTHPEKTGSLHFFEEVFVSSEISTPRSEILAEVTLTEKVKMAALYCDFYNGTPGAPSELVTERLATETLKLAKNRVQHFTEEVRPKFDHVLHIDVGEFLRLRCELVRDLGIDVGSDSDSSQ